jgi:Ca-activated chloride channel homolog
MSSPFVAHPTFRFILRARQLLFAPFLTAQRLAVIVLVLTWLTPAPSQTKSQNLSDDDDIVRVTTDLLLFPIRVRDAKGRAVAGLTEKDLRLEDKDQVTSGIYFVGGVDRVALLFALDQSGSVREVISDQRDAALSLFERFNQRSSIGILQFAETPKIVVPFDRDSSAAALGFRFHSGTNQRTAIFDAAAKSIGSFEILPRVRTERRIVILISDGLDNASKRKPGTVVDEALKKRVSFYVIHVPLFEPRDGRLAVRKPSSGFRELAEKTGGRYFLVKTADQALSSARVDLTPIFQAIEEDLKSQYLLGFYINESSKDGRKHIFSVSLLPPGIKYSVGPYGFSREQKFHVQSGVTNAK